MKFNDVVEEIAIKKTKVQTQEGPETNLKFWLDDAPGSVNLNNSFGSV